MSKLVSLDYLNDYNIEDLRKSIENGFVDLNIKNKLKSKMKVLIKVCLPEAVSKDNAETTHPAVVRAVVDYLTQSGVECIVAECPNKKFSLTYLDDVYLNTGMLEMANLTKCLLNRNLSTADVEIPNGVMTKGVTVLDVINQVDAIINIGKLKIDERLGFCGACSNMFGIIPGNLQTLVLNRFDSLGDYNNYIVDIIETFKTKMILNIVDAVVALEAEKTPRMLSCLAMSECSYCLDAAMLDILGVNYERTILKQAKDRDLIDLTKPYKTIGEKIERFKVEDFILKEFDNHTQIKSSKAYFKTHQQRPYIDPNKCKGCKICSKICPTNAIKMKYDNRGELFAEIDYKKCIYCNKCLTACPYSVTKQITPLYYKKLQRVVNKYNKE